MNNRLQFYQKYEFRFFSVAVFKQNALQEIEFLSE